MKAQVALHRLGKTSIAILFFALSVMVLTSPALGQVTASGALGGTVADKNGAVIKGATVTATNKATGQTRSAMTDDSGAYKIDVLPAGRYDIKVSASGFGDVTAESVELLVGKTSTFDVAMNPGVQTASVTVTAGE